MGGFADSHNDVIRILVQEIHSSLSMENLAKHDESVLSAGRRWRQPQDHIFVEIRPGGRRTLGSIPKERQSHSKKGIFIVRIVLGPPLSVDGFG